MKRSTARWTTALAATAWLGLPAAALAQTPPSPAPQPQQQQPAASSHAQPGSGQEHIRQAQAALNDIPAASLSARAKTRVTELKRHLSALEKSAGTSAAATAPKTTARAKSNWATEVAAIDKILTELLGPATTSATSAPTGATGTAGTGGTTKSKSPETVTLDETTKTKLLEVRSQVTAFAAAMSGTSAPAPNPSPTEPSADPAAAAAAQPPASASAGAQPPAASPASPMAAQQPAPASAQGDGEEAKRHLTAARDTLSQLTQLPAAAQLTGETRTQVSQLITNFNGLINATSNWRAEYDKVNANLTALIGAQSAGAQAAVEPQAPVAGTPGAVGTTGTTAGSLDPAIRAKLVEFRDRLVQFEKVAGAAGGSAASSPESAGSTSSSPSTPSTPSATPTMTTPTMTSASGSTAAATSTPANPPAEQSAAAAQRAEPMGQDSAIRHIEAIEAILSGRSATAAGSTAPGATTPGGNPPSTTRPSSTPPGATPPSSPTGAAGTTGTSPAGPITLDRTQLEQIRMHLAELRKAVEKK